MSRSAFKIPLQSEVETYIKEKKGWPDGFVKHYAEKFWNHYQASGWKLSSGNSIKDWKACFNSQWQVLKFKEDIELLYGKQAVNGHAVALKQTTGVTIKEIADLDQLLARYRLHPTDVPFSSLGKFYPYMKAEKLLKRMYQAEIDELKEVFRGDNEKCRCACVQKTLEWYADMNYTFSTTMEARLKLTK